MKIERTRAFLPLALAGLVAAAMAGVAGAGQPVNLLSNGGFEDGLVGWRPDSRHRRVTDPGASRSGNACLVGEVTGPNQALRLRRSVSVRAGKRYEFEIWARGANRTKLVLWAASPGSKQRRSIATWDRIGRPWRQCRASMSFARSGTLELEIIAPSSFGAPPGPIWIDDVALYETPMPPVTLVSKDGGFNDEPAMAVASDGSVYVAYNSFRSGADSLQAARFRASDDGFQRLNRWRILGGEGSYVLGVDAVSAGENVAVLYAAEHDKNWDVFVAICGPEGPSRPLAVSSHAAVDIKPAAAWRKDVLHVAWESNRNGARQIFAAQVRGGRVSEPQAISRPDASSYGPSIAVLDSGQACVAWHSFRNNNYDVFLRRGENTGEWGPVTRLTHAPSIDRHPILTAHGQELWLVYENAQTEQYYIGRTNRRRHIVAQVTPDGLLVPKMDGADPLSQRCEAGDAAFDSQGRLWLSLLKPRLPRSGWDAFVTCFTGKRWRQPAPISSLKGMDRRPRLAILGDRAVAAFQSDTSPDSWSDLDQMAAAISNIYLASVDTSGFPDEGRMRLAPLVESEEPFDPGQLRVQRGEDLPTPAIRYQGRTLQLFFGDLHEHTDVSICNRLGDQSIDESYQHMRDVARHDFACVTDHGYNINPYLWGYTAKLARVNEDPHRFLTFLGEEWTSTFEEYSESHPYGFYGHRNLILADTYFPRWWNARNRQTPADVWEDLRKLNANFVHIPHQLADTGNVPTDWNYHDETAQPVAEIFQTRGSYEYQGAPRQAMRATPQPGYFLQDAWARGLVIGVIASPDHGGGYGKACVYAPELSREAILDALRARHCYGTTAAKIFLDVRVNGRLMGEAVESRAGDAVEVKIVARCPVDIDRVEVCRNNRFLYIVRPTGRRAELTYVDREPLEGRSYYYVRVIQKDEEIAWSSPVWFGAG